MAIPQKRRLINIALHVLVWAAYLFVPYLFAPDNHVTDTTIVPYSLFTVVNLINIALFYFNALFLSPRFYDKQKKLLYFLLVLVAFVVFSVLKIQVVAVCYKAFANYAFVDRFTFFSGALLLLASIAYSMVVSNIRQERENKAKQAEQMATQLKFLRSQINPHFLFNVLTSLVSLARKKSDRIESSLMMLSDLMRYMLYESDVKKVAISQEIDYLKSYIELQKLRFGDQVDIKTSIHTDNENSSIEPMLLIPFVENAFKHGIGWVDHAFINIALDLRQEVLSFEVRNNYNSDEKSKDHSSGIGLANVQSRLNLLYPDKHTLRLTKENQVFHVRLTLQVE